MNRRDLLIAGSSVAAAGLAYGLRPRRKLSLVAGGKMAAILPATVPGWAAENTDSLVRPQSDDELASRLYSEMIGRIYREIATGEEIMMLIAYGDTQSDLLQLHRPEVCYPAVGFQVTSNRLARLSLGHEAILPVRQLVATVPGRQENIVYWTRMGEYLPSSGGEQREVRLKTAMEGYVPDGALIRFSNLGTDTKSAFGVMDRFVPALIGEVLPDQRKALIGTKLAMKMQS